MAKIIFEIDLSEQHIDTECFIDKEGYLKNPVLTLNHSFENPPIGKVTSMKKDEKRNVIICEADIKWDFGIGFIPKKQIEDNGVTVYKEVELIEISLIENYGR